MVSTLLGCQLLPNTASPKNSLTSHTTPMASEKVTAKSDTKPGLRLSGILYSHSRCTAIRSMGAEQEPRLQMQEFIPERNAVVKMRDTSQKEREECEPDNTQIECKRQVEPVATLHYRGHEHEEEDEAGRERGLPIAPQKEDARRDKDQCAHAVVDGERGPIAVAVLYLPHLCVDILHTGDDSRVAATFRGRAYRRCGSVRRIRGRGRRVSSRPRTRRGRGR